MYLYREYLGSYTDPSNYRSLPKQIGVWSLIWLCAASVLTVVAAAASIWGTSDDHRDIKSGHPSFESLASYTGIWKRDVFIRILGEPDEMDRFALPNGKIHELPVSWATRFLDSPLTDVMSIILSVAAPIFWTQYTKTAIALLTVGAGIQAIGYSIAVIATYRSGIWRKWLRDEQP